MAFDQRVWNACKRIPKGKVSTYKEIAEALHTKAYRAVGNALNRNPHAPIVPCHGRVGGFASGTRNKISLLKKEGVEIRKGKIDLKKYLFRL